jgi:hypothetical protein
MTQPHPPRSQFDNRYGPQPDAYPQAWRRGPGAPPPAAHSGGPYVRPENRHPAPQQRFPYVPPQRGTVAPPPAAPRNGLGLAAVIIAPVGVLFGLVPLTGFVAVICALVTIPLAAVGWARYRKGQATNGRTAVTGLVIGVIALILGVWGITIVANALDELAGPSPLPAAADAAGAPPAVLGQQGAPATTPTAAFGQRVTFDDGVAVELTAPQAFQPSRSAAGADRDRAVTAEVTVVNGSGQPLDAVMVMVRATHGGREAPQIFDSAKGIGGAALGTVLPGKTITFPVAFSVGEGPAELQVEVNPNFLGDPAIFIGQA